MNVETDLIMKDDAQLKSTKNDIISRYCELHDKILEFLEYNDLSLYWLAKRINVPYSTLYKKIHNHTLTPSMMRRIRDTFCNIDSSISEIFNA